MIKYFHCKIIIIIFLVISLLQATDAFCDNNNIVKKYIKFLSKEAEDVKVELTRERNKRLRLFSDDFEDQQSYDEYKEIERDVFISISFKATEDVFKEMYIFRKLERVRNKFFKYCAIEYSKSLSGDIESTLLWKTNKSKNKEYSVLFSLFDHDRDLLRLDFNPNINILYLGLNTGIYYSFRDKEPMITFSHKKIDSYINNVVELSATKKDNNEIVYSLSTDIKF